MPAILIAHPAHGRMHVYSQGELDQHIEWGWSEVNAAPPAPQPVTLTVAPPTLNDAAVAAWLCPAPAKPAKPAKPRTAKSKAAL